MRTASEVRERARLIRRVSPNVLAELFEMQNRTCDLCGQGIQDLILAALDHSTPVIQFARGPLSIEDAVCQANDPSNLRAAHASCNHVKWNRTRDEWFARGLDKKVGTPRVLTDVELLELQFRMSEVGRKNGRIGGRKSKENGTGIHAAGMASKGGSIGGRITGRMNAESGHMAALARKYGSVGGRKVAELGVGVCGRSREKMTEDGRKGGAVSGRMHAESGHCARIAASGGRIGGRIGSRVTNHLRWHQARNIFNPDCALCIAQRKEAA